MSAPDLIPQIPGDPLASTQPATTTTTSDAAGAGTGDTQAPATPQFTAKHNGGGRWKIWQTLPDGGADWFSDFIAAGDGAKAQAEAEAERLNAGGDPLVLDPERLADKAALSTRAPAAKAVDATSLKQAVMTTDGWLCPEPPASKE
ncbi:MAG: hypothetical protein GAK37_00292 [Pseudomonas sp.]|nr:MAG: hypothetical protein GAK37_00292 [Pseudomonas sp.]